MQQQRYFTGEAARIIYRSKRLTAGLTDVKIDVWGPDNTKLVNGSTLTELAEGIYYYDYTPAASGNFVFRIWCDSNPYDVEGSFAAVGINSPYYQKGGGGVIVHSQKQGSDEEVLSALRDIERVMSKLVKESKGKTETQPDTKNFTAIAQMLSPIVSSVNKLTMNEKKYSVDVFDEQQRNEKIDATLDALNIKLEALCSRIEPTVSPMPMSMPTQELDKVLAEFRQEMRAFQKTDWKKIGVYVEKKHDGVACQVHKKGTEVKIFSEDGSDYSDNLPTLVKAVSSQPGTWVVAVEMEAQDNGVHLPRSATAGILNGKLSEREELIFGYVYDVLFIDDKDIHDLPYSQRLVHLHEINGGRLSLTDRKLCKSDDEVRKAIRHYAGLPGSEGAMIKLADFKYELDKQTRNNIKFKTELTLDAKVIKVGNVAGSDKVFYYYCALNSPKGLAFAGKTFNTSIEAATGDVIRVAFVDISGYTDTSEEGGKRWVNWWAPHVLSKIDAKEPDNIEKAWQMVRQTTGRFEDQKEPSILENVVVKDESAKKLTFEQESAIIAENKKMPEAQKEHKFVQAEWTHTNGHPRCLMCGCEHRIGGMCPGLESVGEQNEKKFECENDCANIVLNPSDIGSNVDAYVVMDSDNVVMKKGVSVPVFVPEGLKTDGWLAEDIRPLKKDVPVVYQGKEILWDGNKITVNEKKEYAEGRRFVLQHHWRGKSVHADLRMEGKDFLQGFTLADSFADEVTNPVLSLDEAKAEDAKSDSFKVDWSSGQVKKRLVEGKEYREKIYATPKGKQPKEWLNVEGVTEKLDDPDAGPGATKNFPGVFHILDKGTFEHGAQKSYFKEFFMNGSKLKGRIVFRQVSGLKESKQVLTWLYWKPDEQLPYVLGSRAISEKWLPEGFSALPKALEQKVPDNLNFWKDGLTTEERLMRRELLAKATKDQLSEKNMSEGFILTRRFWKGQDVVRKMEVEDFHIRVGALRFHLDKNPTMGGEVTASEFSGENDYFMPGSYEKGYINPNKKIPAVVEEIDSGRFVSVDKGDLFLQVDFKGESLNGLFMFRRSEKSGKIWTFSKQEAAHEKTVSFSIKEFSLDKPVSSADITFPYRRRAVAFAPGTWNNTTYSWKVLSEAAPRLKGISIVAENEQFENHPNDSKLFVDIGTISDVFVDNAKELIEIEFDIIDTELGKDAALLLANGKIPAVSPQMYEFDRKLSDGRDECMNIVEWRHVCLVKNPGCKKALIMDENVEKKEPEKKVPPNAIEKNFNKVQKASKKKEYIIENLDNNKMKITEVSERVIDG